MTDVAELGLRERKRLATRRAIQLAALRLVKSRGLDNVTIDDISRDADISPRTFFNYFPSKESALVGEGPVRAPEADVEAFVDGQGGLLEDIGRMMTAAAGEALQDQEVITLRKALAADYPHLTAMRMQTFQDFQRDLVAIVARRLARQDPALAADPARLESRAHVRWCRCAPSAVPTSSPWSRSRRCTTPGRAGPPSPMPPTRSSIGCARPSSSSAT